MKFSDKPVGSPKTDCNFWRIIVSPKCEHRLFCSTIQKDVRNMVGYAYCFLLHNTDFCNM